MGVPTTPAYIITAAIGAPLLIQQGVPVLNAHLFAFYFAVLADVTPPVAGAWSRRWNRPMRRRLPAGDTAFGCRWAMRWCPRSSCSLGVLVL
ncbi:TRAP transporter large permease subunit [Paracoccus mutanolyticus]|nr:TRAP transporter large permease subunit [Paracoccus mutanolyticus]